MQSVLMLIFMPLLCRTIYNMCTQKPPNDYSEQLYTRYRESFSVYIRERVRFSFNSLLNHLLVIIAAQKPAYIHCLNAVAGFTSTECAAG